MKKTIIDLFEDSVVKYGAKTFLLEKKHRAFVIKVKGLVGFRGFFSGMPVEHFH